VNYTCIAYGSIVLEDWSWMGR